MHTNVVFISVDTLRPDHMGCYGYGRNTSPHLDALSQQGAIFTQAIAPHIPTIPSHTTFFTGLHALAHTIAGHEAPIQLDRRILLLSQVLQQAGYATAAVDNLVTMGTGKGSWFARGYDYYAGFSYRPSMPPGVAPQAELLTDRAMHLIEMLRDDPFFLFVHYWIPTAHTYRFRRTTECFMRDTSVTRTTRVWKPYSRSARSTITPNWRT